MAIPGRPVVAVVEDEEDMLRLLGSLLLRHGFEVKLFSSASDFLSYLRKEEPDLLVLDVMLPDADGFELCSLLRSERGYRMPILMLTARGEEHDRVRGLEIGADDYLPKPFSGKELVARLRALLRRARPEKASGELRVGEIHIDPEAFEVRVGGERVELTPTEFRILLLLASRRGKVFSRQEILDSLWGYDKVVVDRTVDVHIKNLREKLGSAARFIKNVRGVGYKISEEDRA